MHERKGLTFHTGCCSALVGPVLSELELGSFLDGIDIGERLYMLHNVDCLFDSIFYGSQTACVLYVNGLRERPTDSGRPRSSCLALLFLGELCLSFWGDTDSGGNLTFSWRRWFCDT